MDEEVDDYFKIVDTPNTNPHSFSVPMICVIP